MEPTQEEIQMDILSSLPDDLFMVISRYLLLKDAIRLSFVSQRFAILFSQPNALQQVYKCEWPGETPNLLANSDWRTITCKRVQLREAWNNTQLRKVHQWDTSQLIGSERGLSCDKKSVIACGWLGSSGIVEYSIGSKSTEPVMFYETEKGLASCFLSPELIFGGSYGGDLLVWKRGHKDLVNGVKSYSGKATPEIRSIELIDNNTQLLCASEDHTAKIWDLTTFTLLHTLPIRTKCWVARECKISRTIATGEVGNVGIYDQRELKRSYEIHVPNTSEGIFGLQHNEDILVAGTMAREAVIIDLKMRKEVLRLPSQTGYVDGVQFDKEKLIFSAGPIYNFSNPFEPKALNPEKTISFIELYFWENKMVTLEKGHVVEWRIDNDAVSDLF